MDNKTAQNPNDDGFSLMYGQPFGSPQKPQDSTSDGEPEVKVEEKKTTLPYSPPVTETEPLKEIDQPIEPEPPIEQQTEEVIPEKSDAKETTVTEPQTFSTDESNLIPPTSPVFPANDTSVSDDSTQLPDEPVVEEEIKIEEPALGEENPVEPQNEPIDISNLVGLPSDITTPTTTPMDDIPVNDVTNIQPVPPQNTIENDNDPQSIEQALGDNLPDIPKIEPQENDISNIPETNPEVDDNEPSSIEQAIGEENIPIKKPDIPTKQSTDPVPLPTDITEEGISEDQKPIEIPESPELSEIQDEIIQEIPTQEVTTGPKMTIKDKLLSEETPIKEYPEPPVIPENNVTIPQVEKILTELPPEEVQQEPLIQPIPNEILEPIQTLGPEIPITTEIPTITPELTIETVENDIPMTTSQPIDEPVENLSQQAVSQPLPDPSQNVVNDFIQTPKQPVLESLSEQPSEDSKIINPEDKGFQSPQTVKKLNGLNKSLKFATIIGVIFLVVAISLVAIPSLPYIWYRISNKATAGETESIADPATGTDDTSFSNVIETTPSGDEVQLPEFDATLSYYSTLLIPGIGVDGVIHEGDDPQGALEDGVWRVGDFGTPEDSNTIILAAHRFGYITWTNEFRTENSFYYLPKTKVGDKIEIVWNQRKYEYEITKAEEGTTISDYESDLILYTCKLFNTPVRVFRYADRTN